MQPRCTNGSFSLKLDSGRVAICAFSSPLRGPNGTTHCDVSHHAHQRVPASLASSSDRGRNELDVRERDKKSRTRVGWTGTGMEGDRPGSAIGSTRQAPVPPPPRRQRPTPPARVPAAPTHQVVPTSISTLPPMQAEAAGEQVLFSPRHQYCGERQKNQNHSFDNSRRARRANPRVCHRWLMSPCADHRLSICPSG